MTRAVCKYGSYTFSEYSEIQCTIQCEYDDTGRVVIGHTYRIRAREVIYAEDTDRDVADHFKRVRKELVHPGRVLEILHPGFGEPVKFDPAGSSDGSAIRFGPSPRMVSWLPIGEVHAAEIVWECEVTTLLCPASTARTKGIASWAYQVAWSIDTRGQTARTVTGYVEIANRKKTEQGQEILDSADQYREQIRVAKIPGYHRESSYDLSADKRRLQFRIADRQIDSPNAYGPGVVDIRASHRIHWTRREMATLPQTIDAQIVVAPGVPRARSWEIFRAIVNARLAAAQAQGQTVFLEALTCTEDIFGRTFSYSLQYRLYVRPGINASALSQIFTATNFGRLLQPQTGWNWVQWQASIDAVQSSRGVSRLMHTPGEDRLVNLCTPETLPEIGADAYGELSIRSGSQVLCNLKPPPEKSYTRFESYLEVVEDVPTALQVTVAPDDMTRGFNVDSPLPLVANGSSQNPATRYVESQAGSVELHWRGYAERVGYPIPRPDKVTIGGVQLTRVGPIRFRQSFRGIHLCQPVFAAAWNMRYVASERPKQLDENNDFAEHS